MKSRTSSWIGFLVAVVLMAGAGGFLHSRGQTENLPARQQLASFPLRLGEWTGTEIPISDDVREILGDGDFLQQIYHRAPNEPFMDLFLAYFPTQRTGSTIHSPQNCLPGAGWTPVQYGRATLSQQSGETVTVNRYVIAKGLQRELVLYWYQSHGRVVASEYWAKLYLVADAIRLNRSDGALVRIVTPLGQDENADAAQRRAVEFAELLLAALDPYMPR